MKRIKRNYQNAFYVMATMLVLQTNVAKAAVNEFSVSTVTTEQQKGIIKGKVVDATGGALPGAVIRIVGQESGVNADLDGNFSISLKEDKSSVDITVTFLGFKNQTMKAKAGDFLNVRLIEDNSMLNEVVVTALGIKREEKQLGYSQQTLKSEDLNNARSNNWTDELKGKVAGLTTLSSNSGPMNSANIKLRGDRNIDFSGNYALIVVDGVIVNADNFSKSGNNSYISGDAPVDYGNAIADLNPDDIESITVLKGPGAAALYGSRAGNGALMITTKSGKKGKKGLGVSINSNVSFDVIQKWPDYQYEYGQGTGKSINKDGKPYYSYGVSEDGANTGSTSSAFGPKFDGQYYFQYDPTTETQGTERTLWQPYKNNIKDFWRTGITTTNSIGLSGGNDKGSIRSTITHSKNEWIMPNTGFDRTTISTKAKYEVAKGVTVNSNVSYSNRKSDNLPSTGYGNQTISYFMIFQNPNVDLNWYKPIWKQGKDQIEQIHPFSSYIENPYLIAYETTNGVNANTLTGSLSADIDLAPKLKLMVRGALNSRNDKREERRPFNTVSYGRGYFKTQQINFTEINTDFLLSYTENGKGSLFNYSASVGGNMLDSKWHSISNSVNGLVTPGVYMLANGIDKPSVGIGSENKKVNSLYGMATFGYKNMIFVDATLRNDWSSTLHKGNWSFMYPSVNTSFVLSDMLPMPSFIDYSKLRVSYAEVGNGTEPNRTKSYYNNSDFPSSALSPSMLYNTDLKPVRTNSFEIGYEHRMFKNRLGFDVTLYETRTHNQIIIVPLNWATGYSSAILNTGIVRNRGIELVVNATPIKTKNFTWNTTVNWAKNQNRILELADEFEGGDQQVLAEAGTAQIIGKVGGTTGDMYGYKFVRNDEGKIVYTDKGLPVQSKEIEYIGSAYADFTAGWVNTLKYKNFTFSFTLDGSFGGKVYSQTHHKMSEQGKLKHTLAGREEGFIIGDGVVLNKDGSYSPNTTKVNPADFYGEYYRRANLESNTFDATYVKLRDITLEYSFPKKTLERLKLTRLSMSVYGRNLLTISDFPMFDPETAALNSGGMMPGVEMGQMPSPATYGLNLKLEF